MEEPDPLDQWKDPTEIQNVSFTGKLLFSCCRLTQVIDGDKRSEVQCVRCGTVYGVALLARLLTPEDYKYAKGTRVRVTQELEVKVGSTLVKLVPGQIYQAAQDTYGALNIPPGYQPFLVEVPGDRGTRYLIAVVPDEIVESADAPQIFPEESKV
jgi:hypothetical protein